MVYAFLRPLNIAYQPDGCTFKRLHDNAIDESKTPSSEPVLEVEHFFSFDLLECF
jgi:hypothetical protein